MYKAQEFELVGFVHNNDDGTVELVAEGEQKKLEEFLDLLRHGHSAAVVKNISINWLNATGEFTSFEITG
jgi:acylphosphatase